MKKKIIILGIVTVLFLCGCGKKETTTDLKPLDGFSYDEYHEVEICKDSYYCKIPFTVYYNTIRYDTKNKEVLKIVDEINQQITKDYQKTMKSKLDSKVECDGVKGVYQYQYAVDLIYHVYTDQDYVMLGLTRTEYDACKNKVTSHPSDVKIFDKKTNKILSQKEFKNQIQVTDEMIHTALDDFVKEMKENGEMDVANPTIDYANVVLFYDGGLGLQASFKIKELNDYYIASIPLKEDS